MSDEKLIQPGLDVVIPTHLTAGMKESHITFARHLAVTDNQTQSAMKSGSKHKTARSYGSRLAKRNDVQAVVEYVRQAIISQSELTPDYVIDKLKEVIKKGMKGVEIKGPGGKGTGVEKMSDASSVVRALELIGRYHGMWDGDGPKVDVDVSVGVANLSDTAVGGPEWDRLVSRYLALPTQEKAPESGSQGLETANEDK